MIPEPDVGQNAGAANFDRPPSMKGMPTKSGASRTDGFIEPSDCYSTVSLFFWALVLMICVRTLPQPPAETGADEAGNPVD